MITERKWKKNDINDNDEENDNDWENDNIDKDIDQDNKDNKI